MALRSSCWSGLEQRPAQQTFANVTVKNGFQVPGWNQSEEIHWILWYFVIFSPVSLGVSLGWSYDCLRFWGWCQSLREHHLGAVRIALLHRKITACPSTNRKIYIYIYTHRLRFTSCFRMLSLIWLTSWRSILQTWLRVFVQYSRTFVDCNTRRIQGPLTPVAILCHDGKMLIHHHNKHQKHGQNHYNSTLTTASSWAHWVQVLSNPAWIWWRPMAQVTCGSGTLWVKQLTSFIQESSPMIGRWPRLGSSMGSRVLFWRRLHQWFWQVTTKAKAWGLQKLKAGWPVLCFFLRISSP